MTALQQYQRLETTGLWRASEDAQRRDVTVSFGDATLVISDQAGRALTHWSLPAIEKVSVAPSGTIYAPAQDATETLELSDATMLDAIETVRKALSRQKPKPGRVRATGRVAVAAGMLGLAVFWLPGALRNQTLAVVTQTKRIEIGATVLGHMQFQNGLACRTPSGLVALKQLHRRVFGTAAAGQIVVLPGDSVGAVNLPGGIIAITQAVLRVSDDPAVPAGFVIAAHARTQNSDPLGTILDGAGLRDTMRLLTTGQLSDDALQSFASELQFSETTALPLETLVAAFEAADVSAMGFAASTGRSDLSDADPMQGRTTVPVLPDSAWVSLQGICDS